MILLEISIVFELIERSTCPGIGNKTWFFPSYGKNVGFQVIPFYTAIDANNGDTTEIIGQLSLHEQRKLIPNEKMIIFIFHRLLESISMGGGVSVPEPKRLFELGVPFRDSSLVQNSPETSVSERARSQLFRTPKNFENGSQTKKLRGIMCLTLMFKSDRLFLLSIKGGCTQY